MDVVGAEVAAAESLHTLHESPAADVPATICATVAADIGPSEALRGAGVAGAGIEGAVGCGGPLAIRSNIGANIPPIGEAITISGTRRMSSPMLLPHRNCVTSSLKWLQFCETARTQLGSAGYGGVGTEYMACAHSSAGHGGVNTEGTTCAHMAKKVIGGGGEVAASLRQKLVEYLLRNLGVSQVDCAANWDPATRGKERRVIVLNATGEVELASIHDNSRVRHDGNLRPEERSGMHACHPHAEVVDVHAHRHCHFGRDGTSGRRKAIYQRATACFCHVSFRAL